MGVILAAVILIAVIGAVMVCMKRGGMSSSAEDTEKDRHCGDTAERERKREAHYMRNFWSYDGSEQQEWEG